MERARAVRIIVRTLLFEAIDGCILLVHGPRPPAEREWDEYLGALRGAVERGEAPRVLVTTGGAAAAPRQMLRSLEIMKPVIDRVRIAVVTEAPFVRGVAVSLVRAVTSNVALFYPDRLDDALRYLELPPERWADARRRVEEAQATLRKK